MCEQMDKYWKAYADMKASQRERDAMMLLIELVDMGVPPMACPELIMDQEGEVVGIRVAWKSEHIAI